MMRSLLLFCSAALLLACTNAAPEKQPAVAEPPLYFFYPRANVYFDSANSDYLFMAGDGGTWQAQKQIPEAMQALMDKSVLIDSPAQPVWKDNERHKLIYAALLYASPADTQTVLAPPVALPQPPKVEVKKERKGLRKFFGKLFGKKKKDSTARQ